MGSVYGEGKGEGTWVLYKGKKYWLSDITQDLFRNFKEKDLRHSFFIEKDGERVLTPLDQLELAE